MSDPFIGEIRLFAGNFAPRDWAFCEGQLLPISQNNALFSLLGTTYGGDGQTTFGLPDLRGRLPIHAGSGPGLTARQLGSKGGQETVTVRLDQLPSHTHPLQASRDVAHKADPVNNVPGQSPSTHLYYEAAPVLALHPDGINATGGGQAHPNMVPFLCLNFIIALVGIYPSRN